MVGLEILGQQIECPNCGEDFCAETRVACPECGRDLRMRAEYIGRRVTCKKCAHTFRATLAEETVLLSPVSPKGSPKSSDAEDDESAHDGPTSIPTPKYGIDPELNGLSSEAPSIVDARAVEIEELRAALEARAAEAEKLRAELLETQARGRNEAEAEQITQQQLCALKSERASMEKEVERLQDGLKEKAQQAGRAQGLAQALAELEAQRDQLVAERDEGLHKATELQSRAAELEQTLGETAAALQKTRLDLARQMEEQAARAQADRKALGADWEQRHKRYVSEAERQLGELQGRFQTARLQEQQRVRDLEEQSQQAQEAFQKEIELLRSGMDALRQERDAILGQFDALQQSRPAPGVTVGQLADSVEQLLRDQIAKLEQQLESAAQQENAAAARVKELAEQLRSQELQRQQQARRETEQQKKLAALQEELQDALMRLDEQEREHERAQEQLNRDYEALRKEADQFREKSALLSQQMARLTSRTKEIEESRQEAAEQTRVLKAELGQQQHVAEILMQDLERARNEAAADQERLAKLLAEEQARVQTEHQAAQDRLAATVQQFDQERKGLRDNLQRTQQECAALRLERSGLLGRISELTAEEAALKLERDELEVSCRAATECSGEEAARLSETLQQTQRQLRELQVQQAQSLKQEKDYERKLAVVQREREVACAEALEARSQLEIAQQTLEKERLDWAQQLESLDRDRDAARRLSETLQQTQRQLQELQAQHARSLKQEKDYERKLSVVQREREAACADATEARRQLELAQQALEKERLDGVEQREALDRDRDAAGRLSETLQQTQRQLQELQAQHARSLRQEKEFERKLSVVQGDHAAACAEATEARKQLAMAQQALEKERLDWIEQVESLHGDRDAAGRVSETLQQTQRQLQELQAQYARSLKQEKDYERKLSVVQREREAACAETTEARRQLEMAQQALEKERLDWVEQLELLHRELAAAREASATAPPAGESHLPDLAHVKRNLDELFPPQVAQLAKFAQQIEALELEISRQSSQGNKTHSLRRGLAALGRTLSRLGGNTSYVDEAEDQIGQPDVDHYLRALWTEVMTERERMIRSTAEAVCDDLTRQLADARNELQAATERAEELEAEMLRSRPVMQESGEGPLPASSPAVEHE
jgi:chromosome segregation ATPase